MRNLLVLFFTVFCEETTDLTETIHELEEELHYKVRVWETKLENLEFLNFYQTSKRDLTAPKHLFSQVALILPVLLWLKPTMNAIQLVVRVQLLQSVNEFLKWSLFQFSWVKQSGCMKASVSKRSRQEVSKSAESVFWPIACRTVKLQLIKRYRKVSKRASLIRAPLVAT